MGPQDLNFPAVLMIPSREPLAFSKTARVPAPVLSLGFEVRLRLFRVFAEDLDV